MSASFDVAFDWIMQFEDPKRTYEMTPDAPPGAHAIAGINSYSFPSAFRRIVSYPSSHREPLVKQFYRDYFWNAGWYGQLESDEIAKRVFDAAVNMGSTLAGKLLQRACEIADDGVWGPETMDALVIAFQKVRKQYYLDIVKAKPEDIKYLAGWMARCER